MALAARIVGAVWIDQGCAFRRGCPHQMVVDHNHRKVDIDGFSEGMCSRRTAIHGDHEIRALIFKVTKRFRAWPIPFGQAVRNIKTNLLPPSPEIARQDRRTGSPINVIVGKDRNRLSRHDRIERQLRRFHHILKAGWIWKQGAKSRVQKGLNLLSFQAARCEQASEQIIAV